MKIDLFDIAKTKPEFSNDLRSPEAYVSCNGKVYSGHFHCNGYFYPNDRNAPHMWWDKSQASTYDSFAQVRDNKIDGWVFEKDVQPNIDTK